MRAKFETSYAELDADLAKDLWDKNRGEGVSLEAVYSDGDIDIIICNEDEQAIGMIQILQVNALYLAKSIITMIELNGIK